MDRLVKLSQHQPPAVDGGPCDSDDERNGIGGTGESAGAQTALLDQAQAAPRTVVTRGVEIRMLELWDLHRRGRSVERR